MIWVPGGEFWMGSSEPTFGDARPWHKTYVDGFWMDKTEVTNEEFARFVKATGYVTIAERKPRAEDYPTAPPENLSAGSVVFTPPDHPVALNDHFQWWSYVKGANWRHPEGPLSSIKGKENHPVVHIAYEDALAYCKWAGKRLPTEAEYEFAERGGLDRKPYAWGDEFRPKGKFMANTFQGHFPDKNTGEDGYVGPPHRSVIPAQWLWPVRSCRETSGNGPPTGTAPITTRASLDKGEVARNPQGPSTASIRANPASQKSSAWRLLSLYGSVLQPLHGWRPRQRRA